MDPSVSERGMDLVGDIRVRCCMEVCWLEMQDRFILYHLKMYLLSRND